jgi:hypothetical protein
VSTHEPEHESCWFLESQQPDGTWEQSSLSRLKRHVAENRYSVRLVSKPHQRHRIVRADTSITYTVEQTSDREEGP